jgi:hypothetical protein
MAGDGFDSGVFEVVREAGMRFYRPLSERLER